MLVDVEISSSVGMTQPRREFPKGSKDAGPMKTRLSTHLKRTRKERTRSWFVLASLSESVLVLRQLLPKSLT